MHLLSRPCRPVWIGLSLLILLSLPFALSNVDLFLAGWFYQNGWPWGDQGLWQLLYRFGTLPGLLLAVGSLVILAGGWIWPRLAPRRRAAALIALTLLIGPGLLVNSVGKTYWGRPRPRDITAFNGSRDFLRFCQPGIPGRGASFPCGHASVGFLIAALFFTDPGRRRRWVWLGAGFGYGLLMGTARMAQGAHFASDVLWSGGITFLTAAALDCLLPRGLGQSTTSAKPGRRTLGWIALSGSLAGLGLAFVLATPFYQEWSGTLPAQPETAILHLTLPPSTDDVVIRTAIQQPALIVHARLQGFGLPKVRLAGALQSESVGMTLSAQASLRLNRWVTERRGTVEYWVKEGLVLALKAKEVNGDISLGDENVPVRYAGVEVETTRTNIRWALGPGSVVSGPVRLMTQQGDLWLAVNQLADPGTEKWELGADRGIVVVQLAQTEAPAQALNLRAWSRWKHVAFNAIIGPACGLDVQWDEGDGRSNLEAKGAWLRKDANRVTGPGDVEAAGCKVFLATSDGLINMDLRQGPGRITMPLAAPTPEPDWAHLSTKPEWPPAPEPTPALSPALPDWAEKELISQPKNPNSPAEPRGPFTTEPTPGR